jgi:oligoribonuclease
LVCGLAAAAGQQVSSLIFLDLETTGLDPEKCEILELGMLAIEYGSLREVAAVQTCLQVSSGFVGSLDEKVLQMHTASGLLADVRGERANLRFEAGGWPTLAQAEAQAIGWMNLYGGQRSPLAGYNPEFDRSFLRKRMPRLEANFHYRNFDVNFVHLLREVVTGTQTKKEGVTHRALDDCRHAAAALRSFLGG